MPTSRKSKRKPRLTKAQINYAMMAHVEKRVGALEDKYNGLGGAVDAVDLRVRELGRQVEAMKKQLAGIDNLLMSPTGNMQGRLDAVERKVRRHESQNSLIFATFDEMKSAPKPKPWYVRAFAWLIAPYRPSNWWKDHAKRLEENYNATHPLTKEKQTPAHTTRCGGPAPTCKCTIWTGA